VDHARPRHPRRGLRHIDTALGHRHYALVFLEPRTRRLHITDVTAHPTQAWTAQQARNLTASMDSLRLMLRDHDGKYSAAFDEVFRADGTDILTTAPRTPRTNAHPRERVIKTPRSEVRAPADRERGSRSPRPRHVLAEYQRHYKAHRPHQARQRRPPDIQRPTNRTRGASTGKAAAHTCPPWRHHRVPLRRLTCGDDFRAVQGRCLTRS
jgi:putative transposase